MEEQLKDIKIHEAKLMEKTMEFDRKLSAIEEHQKNQDTILNNIKNDIIDTIHESVSNRISDMQAIVIKQQETQAEILKIQGKQGEQIDSIQATLQKFSEISKKVESHESRLIALESSQRNELELRKEKVKGWWAIAAGLVSGIVSIITVLITVFGGK